MTPKEADAIAKILRRNHGDAALEFALSQITYFRTRPSGASAVLAWHMVCRALGGDLVEDAVTDSTNLKRSAAAAASLPT
jgi:hypothetical protein